MDVNVLLFDDFETLDTFGAVEILGQVEEYRLRYFSVNGGIILSKQGMKIITEQLKDADFTGILLVPGGQGTRHLVNDNIFIEQLTTIVAQSKYCLTVCTGSALLAKTNLLNNRKATSNKRALEWVKSLNSNVEWENCARWVVDGKFYTSSGISAGIDMALGFVSDRISLQKSIDIAQGIEYVWNCNKNNDLFAK